MNEPQLHVPGALPTDPAYERFAVGLHDVVEQRKNRRWQGHDQKWWEYAAADWILEDARLPDTQPESALEWDPPRFRWEVHESYFPDLFTRLKAAYEEIKAKNPRLGHPVWSPWGDGDWRNAIRRAPSGPPKDIPQDLPPAALARIARVKAFEAKDALPRDDAQTIINEIVREYT